MMLARSVAALFVALLASSSLLLLFVQAGPSPLETGLKSQISSSLGSKGGAFAKKKEPLMSSSNAGADLAVVERGEDPAVQEENFRFSVFMQILLPSMFNLFSNITSDEFKAQFQEPCRFDALLEIFSKLPPYFDKIGNKFPRNPELVAYYSMQLASTFLVNNGSLTMACLYNMLSLQTKLQSFSLDIMDNPESHPELVGKFGIVMKPLMAKLKQNTMMKIIEHVDKYDKNDSYFTITLFHIFNVVFVSISIVGILSNLFLIILLRRSSVAKKPVVTIRTSSSSSRRGMIKSPPRGGKNGHGSLKRGSGHHHHRSKSASGGHSSGSLSRSASKRHKSPMPHKQRFTDGVTSAAPNYNHYEGITLEKKTLTTTTYTAAAANPANLYRLSGTHRIGQMEYQKQAELIPLTDNGNGHGNGDVEPVDPILMTATGGVDQAAKRSRIYMNANEIPEQLHVQIKQTRLAPKRSRSSRSAGGKGAVRRVQAAQMSTASILLRYIRRRYKTRLCIILIALCHSLYLLMNFIVMSQAGVAAVALKGLNQLNLACKVSFFLFPPTTAYNLLHQFAIWLLFYAIRSHSQKLRRQRSLHEYDCDEDYDIDLMDTDEDEDSDYDSRHLDANDEEEEDEEDEETLSITLTNNSNKNNNLLMAPGGGVPNHSYVKFNMNPMAINTTSSYSNSSLMNSNSTNQPILASNGGYHRHQPIYAQTTSMIKESSKMMTATTSAMKAGAKYAKVGSVKVKAKDDRQVASFSSKRKNLIFAVFLFILLCIYNSQSLFLYSLATLSGDEKKGKPGADSTIYYCAFDETYSSLFQLLNQYVIPLLNLSLFSLLPLFFCSLVVLFDLCFLLRIYRSNQKQYLRLKEIIEWPLYAYYAVYMVSQLPFALHQLSDLAVGTAKFPFVFPIFIHMKFTSKVALVIIEMMLMCLAYSSDLYVWILCDKDMRRIVSWWLNKRILCRTTFDSHHQQHSSSAATSSAVNSSTSSSTGSRSGGNGGGSTTCSRSSNFSSDSNSGVVCEPAHPAHLRHHALPPHNHHRTHVAHHHGHHHVNEKKMPLQSISPKNLTTTNLVQTMPADQPSPNHLNVGVNNANSNSCGSSTISTSMTISSATAAPVQQPTTVNPLAVKKKLSAEAIKAKAAISALDMPPNIDTVAMAMDQSPELSSRSSSLSPTSDHHHHHQSNKSSPQPKQQSLRMIDTDIDDIDDADVSERCHQHQHMSTIADTSVYLASATSAATDPPSFDSAVQAKQSSSSRLASNLASTHDHNPHHQYQNVL